MAFPAKATTTEVLWVSYDEPLRTAECGDTIIRFTPHLDDSNGDTANWNTLDWNSVNWAAINWIGVSNWDMTVSDDSVTEDETTLIPVSEQESDESVATRQVFLPLVTK